MGTLAVLFIILGSFCAIVAWVYILIEAFATNTLWGLGVLALPIVTLGFIVLYFRDIRTPAIALVTSNVVVMTGVILSLFS